MITHCTSNLKFWNVVDICHIQCQDIRNDELQRQDIVTAHITIINNLM